jgi:hypothetical protein
VAHRYHRAHLVTPDSGRHLGRVALHHRPRRGDECGYSQSYGQVKMQRRGFLLATLGAVACGRRDNSALGRAARWLWSQQGDDGGWHSKTYGCCGRVSR